MVPCILMRLIVDMLTYTLHSSKLTGINHMVKENRLSEFLLSSVRKKILAILKETFKTLKDGRGGR